MVQQCFHSFTYLYQDKQRERGSLKMSLFNYLLTDQRYNYIIILLLVLENTICFPFQVNIFNTTTTNSPKADGLNAMQSWVICCIFFVFGALFEYAIILLQMKIKTFRKLAASMQKDETCAMDVAVLIAFPIVFLIFNIVYWAAFHLWIIRKKSTQNWTLSIFLVIHCLLIITSTVWPSTYGVSWRLNDVTYLYQAKHVANVPLL